MRQYLIVVEVIGTSPPRQVTSQVVTVADHVGPITVEQALQRQAPEHHTIYVYDLAAVL
jgi:glutamate racemase